MADYAISNVPRRVVYAPSGVGPYAFTFEILNQTDIAVYKASTLLTLTTDYTVTINANGTGSVTLVATAGTSNITIVGAKNIQRTTDFTTGGDLFANTLNDELDNQTIFIQQVAETAERGLKAPVTDPTDIAMTLPAKADRASKYLGFDSNGNPVASSGTGADVVSTAMEPVVSAATLAAGRTNFGLGTMATQVASAVAITGGTINSTTIGATTATTATFTTATVNKVEDSQGGVLAPISSVMRNRIINGAMVLDQRNAGASVTPANAQYTLDRWQSVASVSSKYSIQQNAGSVTPPAGFTNYLGVTSLSSYSVGAGEVFAIFQPIEGFSTADLDFGKTTAKTVTLSFWVRSSLTGTFGGSLTNSAFNRSYPFSYTISSANTWEQKSVTIAGDTTGTWVGATNGTGLNIQFSLGTGTSLSGTAGYWSGSTLLSATGATSVVGTNGATFYITGVQLEKGTQATSFEYRQYGQELALCQRYFWKIYGGLDGGSSVFAAVGAGYSISASEASIMIPMQTQMRASPTLAYGGSLLAQDGGAASVTGIVANYGGKQSVFMVVSTTGSNTTGNGLVCFTGSTYPTDFVSGSAEL